MARKSRETKLKEQLRAVSDCPFDILDYLDCIPELFSMLGDGDSEESLMLRLYELCRGADGICNALVYLMRHRLDCGSRAAAELAVRYCLLTDADPQLACDALDALSRSDNVSDELAEDIARLRSRLAVYYAAEGGEDAPLPDFDVDRFPIEGIYVAARRGSDNVIALADSVGLGMAVRTPAFGIGGEISPSDAAAQLDRVIDAILYYPFPDWRDKWLRCAYELLNACGAPLSKLCDVGIAVSLGREGYPQAPLHVLAWYECMIAEIGADSPQGSKLRSLADEVLAQCLFAGLPVFEGADERERLIRECIYTDSRAEREKAEIMSRIGTLIIHSKNRYLWVGELSGHAKRGKNHYWEINLALPPADAEGNPNVRFDNISTVEVRHIISRGGVEVPFDRTASQIIMNGEIIISEVRHPLQIDLILDISYISSVKCSGASVTVRKKEIKDGFLVMDCQIYFK